jgi:tetratricopeptide (TPR) repeat protein
MQRHEMKRAWCAWTVAVGLAALAPSAAGAGPDGERLSLEQLLERARAKQLEAQAQLRAQLDALLGQFAPAGGTPTPADLEALEQSLVRLGTEAAPLLLAQINLPESASENERLRARRVAAALAQLDTSAVTRELLALLEQPSPLARRYALIALSGTPEPQRVRPVVHGLYKQSAGSLKHEALRTLLALRDGYPPALIDEVLAEGEETAVGLLLDALTAKPSNDTVESVRRILHDGANGPKHALRLMRYFASEPSLAAAADTQAFVRMATSAALGVDLRVELLGELAPLKPALNGELKRALEPSVSSADRKLREAALVLLTRLGDKNSRRELLREADEVVTKNDGWSESYVRRGDIYARIGEDEDAIKDYRQALVVGKNDPSLNADTWVKLARAYTRRGKYKDAGDTLRRSPLGDSKLKELAEDPEFKPLRESKYGKSAFGL